MVPLSRSKRIGPAYPVTAHHRAFEFAEVWEVWFSLESFPLKLLRCRSSGLQHLLVEVVLTDCGCCRATPRLGSHPKTAEVSLDDKLRDCS